MTALNSRFPFVFGVCYTKLKFIGFCGAAFCHMSKASTVFSSVSKEMLCLLKTTTNIIFVTRFQYFYYYLFSFHLYRAILLCTIVTFHLCLRPLSNIHRCWEKTLCYTLGLEKSCNIILVSINVCTATKLLLCVFFFLTFFLFRIFCCCCIFLSDDCRSSKGKHELDRVRGIERQFEQMIITTTHDDYQQTT